MKILLAEDDPKIAAFVVAGLEENGRRVDHISDGRDAPNYCLYNVCDAHKPAPKRRGSCKPRKKAISK